MPDSADLPGAGLPFILEIDGIARGAFAHCSGLERGEAPAAAKPATVVLSRGLVRGTGLSDWARPASPGAVERKNVTIFLLDEAGSETSRWTLPNAFPVKFEGPSLSASGNEVAIESIELSYEGVSLDDDPAA